MIRFSLPPGFISRPYRAPQPVTVNVQRSCAHYERVIMPAVPGMWRDLKREQRKLCADCQEQHLTIAQLAYAPRLRLHSEHGVWAVERLLGTAAGTAFHVVAWLASREQCLEWIANTFYGRPYELVEELP